MEVTTAMEATAMEAAACRSNLKPRACARQHEPRQKSDWVQECWARLGREEGSKRLEAEGERKKEPGEAHGDDETAAPPLAGAHAGACGGAGVADSSPFNSTSCCCICAVRALITAISASFWRRCDCSLEIVCPDDVTSCCNIRRVSSGCVRCACALSPIPDVLRMLRSRRRRARRVAIVSSGEYLGDSVCGEALRWTGPAWGGEQELCRSMTRSKVLAKRRN